MKKCFKKAISGILASAMLFSSLTFANTSVFAANFGSVGGWFESIYAEIPGIEDADVTGVSYKGTMSGSLTGEDFQYLVRDYNGGVRIDIPGLQAGVYTLTVNTSEGTLTKDNISVMEYDRSGYAHFNYNDGVGAYKDDGTLKDNAVVLYVTDENKEEVTVTAGGVTVTGIGNILNSVGATQKEPGALTNTNQGILLKLAQEGRPLVVRFIGEVTAPQGLTAYDSADYGGTEGDNGYMARMQNAKDVTLEGIGNDALVDGWGFHFICQTAYPQFGKSFEARNIEFRNVPEDCVGMEGQQESGAITAGVERCWIHNCAFYGPHISNPAESDKDGGDGACDFKRGQYFTNSYCYYEGYHKTNLVGSSDSSLQYNMTYHHNYWKDCEARGPLARQANIHMYNNVYEGQKDYAMNPRANAYIFSEYNLFYQCKNPMQIKSGAIKSYNDSLTACIEDIQADFVTDKNQTVSSSNKYANFDTDSSLSYIPGGNYKLDESVKEAKKNVMAYAGPMKDSVVMPDEVNTSILLPDRQPTASVQLPYDHALNSSYVTGKNVTVDNVIFNVNKISADCVSTNTDNEGQSIVFHVNQPVHISVTDGGGTYPVVLMDSDGIEYLTGSGVAENCPAGTYIIQSSGFQPAKSNSPLKYKEAKIAHLSIISADEEAPTIAEPTTQTTSEGYTETTTKKDSGDIEEPSEGTTSSPYEGEGLVWDYTNGTNTLNAKVDANEWGNAEPVSYNGATFTSAIKMESSTKISFNAPGSGKLTLVTYSGKAEPKIKINGESIAVSKNGATTVDIAGGTVNIAKDTTDTYLYVMEFVGAGTSDSTTTTVTETTTETTSTVTESSSETTTETTSVATESSSETTTENIPDPEPSEKVYGDVDGNGILEINDASLLIDMVLKGAVEVKDGITDVTNDGKVDTADIATILQKILDGKWQMPCEPDNENTTEITTEDLSEDTTEGVNNSFYDFNDNPPVVKDGTSGITYTVSTKEGEESDLKTAEAVIADKNGSPALYIKDESKTDTVKVTIPLSEKNSGKVTYTAKITPSVASTNWTIVQLNGIKADDTESEVLGIRTDKNKAYGIRVNGGSDVTSSNVVSDADKEAIVIITVDFDNNRATLSVNGSTPIEVTGFDAKSVTSISFQTATGERNLYIDDTGIIEN